MAPHIMSDPPRVKYVHRYQKKGETDESIPPFCGQLWLSCGKNIAINSCPGAWDRYSADTPDTNIFITFNDYPLFVTNTA